MAGPDLTTEAGAFASSYYGNASAVSPAKAFDNDPDTEWASDSDDVQWLGCEIESAAVIKITITSGPDIWDAERCPTTFEIRAANSEPTDGATDGVLLDSVTIDSDWNYPETREFVFSNSTSYTHYWIYMTDKKGVFGKSIEYRIFEFTMHARGEFSGEDTDDAGLSGAGDAFAEYSAEGSDTLSLSGTGAYFDYSAVAAYLPYSVDRYWAVVSGAADGLADLVIPISQFSARYQTGRNSYLSVVVPDYAGYIDGIEARSNGELILMAAYYYGGAKILEQELLRVDLVNINPSIGATSVKIVLDGRRELTVVGVAVAMTGAQYSQTQSGVTQYGFPYIDFYIRPGDTVTVDDDEAMVIDAISYQATPTRRSMTIKSE